MGDLGSIPGLGKSPGAGNGNQHQYSCLEKPIDGGTWQSAVLEVTKSRTGHSNFTFLGTKCKGHRVEYKTSFQSLYSLMHAAAAKSLQWCPTLCDPIDSSPPGSAFPGILQARTLEWVAISFSNA